MTGFDCWLMGWGALLIESGDLLVEHGCAVTGVASRYDPARQWAAEAGIPAFATLDELRRHAERPDYLFSITNDVVLREQDLALPTRMAINLHSSLLPRYAGVHQTTWALLHDESEHGITWHEMTPRIDGGRILRQARFPVKPDDTTLTLNIRCHEYGLSALGELIEDLRSDTLRPRPQNPEERSYFGASRLFPEAGLTTWRRPAVELDRWCRAGDFGPFDNRFGQPRVVVGETMFVLRGLRLTGRASEAPAGTVTAVTEQAAVVATGSDDVEIVAVATPDGRQPAVGELFAALGLGPGDRLDVEERRRDLLTAWLRAHGPHENFWLEVLERTASGRAVSPERPLWVPRPADGRSVTLVDRRVLDAATSAFPGHDVATLLVTAWLVCLGEEWGTPRWSDDSTRAASAGLHGLVARDVPLDVTVPPSSAFGPALRRVAARLDEIRGRGAYLRDVPARYPMHGVAERAMPVALAVSASGEHPAPAPDTAVTIGLDTLQCACHVVATDHLGPAETVAQRFASIGRDVSTLLAAASREPMTPLGALRTAVPLFDQH